MRPAAGAGRPRSEFARSRVNRLSCYEGSMGLIYANTWPLLEEHVRRPLGRVLFLGYPDIYFSRDSFRHWCELAGAHLGPLTDEADPKRPAYPSARAVFRALGVEFQSLDASSLEGADVIFDLNSALTPHELAEQWDVIVDHGTMEHVFHLPNMLAHLYRMLKPGGRIIHSSPGNNFFDHGLYQFSPTFFSDYYGENGWRTVRQLVVQFSPEQETEPAFFTPYQPSLFEGLSYGGMDGKLYSNLFIGEKVDGATHDRIPTQGYYKSRWN